MSSNSSQVPAKSPSETALFVYYCICSEFILVIDTKLSFLPRRQTDDSTVIRVKDGEDGERAQVFKISAVLQDPILLHRQGGVEKQWRLNCARCGLPVGYQTSGPPGKYVYILEGALSMDKSE